jgi:hypothetical protein
MKTADPRRALRALGMTIGLLVTASSARAEGEFIPPWPEDFNKVEMSLLTIGRGPQPHALFGHTILRVQDPERKLDMNFNWGIFDFLAPGFALKFYKGDLDYQLAISSFASNVKHYRNFEKRSMLQERLELTLKQKEALYRRLVENAQPENLFYKYSQFRDNCATRLRDHLDAVLGGKVREFFFNRPSPATFRWHIRANAEPAWWVYLGLDTVSNDWLDKPITNWDEMFLPGSMQKYLRQMPAFDDDGNPIPGKNLLTGAEMIIDLPEPAPKTSPYVWIALVLGVPTLALSALFVTTSVPSWRPRSLARDWRRPAVVAFGLLSVVLGLWSGVLGTILTANWIVSSYGELKHNANLWLFWPTDWLYVAYGVYLIKHRSPPVAPVSSWWLKAVGWATRAHLVALVVALLLALSGVIRQDILAIWASSGLALGAFYLTVTRFGTLRGI